MRITPNTSDRPSAVSASTAEVTSPSSVASRRCGKKAIQVRRPYPPPCGEGDREAVGWGYKGSVKRLATPTPALRADPPHKGEGGVPHPHSGCVV
ncbi:hypothetical protein GCM10010837_40640 [Aminobacter niigataensis]